MSVLDIGSGVGDVALISAQLDAIAGRHILIHLPDPAVMIRAAIRFLRPGGVAVFQEYDFSVIDPSYPKAPLRDDVMGIFRDFFGKAGKESMGTMLFHLFSEAGLHSPECRAEYPITGGPESAYYEVYAESRRSILPRAVAPGIVDADNVDIDTLADRLREEAIANKSAYPMPPMVGGFAFRPW